MLEILLWGLYIRMCVSVYVYLVSVYVYLVSVYVYLVSVYVYLCVPNLCVHECMRIGVYYRYVCMYVHI